MRISTKKIAYIALLAAISVVLNLPIISVFIPPDIKISFVYIPAFIAGFYFGPGVGFFVGVIGDILGCIIAPQGAWLPLMTLASGLMGAIPGLVRILKVNEKVILVISYIITYFVCSMFLNTYAVWHVYIAAKKSFWIYYATKRMIPTILTMLANMSINLLLFPLFNKVILPRAKSANAA